MFSSNSSTVSGDANYIEDVFSTYLYTGNDSTQTITNGIDLAGKGGLVWMKGRGAFSENHNLIDTARGITKSVSSNNTADQITNSGAFTAFNSNGFSLGPVNAIEVNANARPYASWTFREQPKFFDVVTYTGNTSGGSSQTIAHNLGSTPGCIIIKATSIAGEYWAVWHRSFTTNQVIYLNLTNAVATTGAGNSFPVLPTATDFTVGFNGSQNGNGTQYVAYLFAHNAGGFGLTGTDNVVSCGSYAGVAYPNSQEVNVGFEPQWVMIKNTTTASGWSMWDSMRGMAVVPAANVAQAQLLEPNTTAAEGIQPGIYPTATGFVVKNGLTAISGLGDNFIYIAIRRGPMKVPTDGTKVYNAIARTGTSAVAKITGVGFSPDAVWGRRKDANYGRNFDRLRGVNVSLAPAATAGEATPSASLTSYDMDGFSVGADPSEHINAPSIPYIYWNFKRAPGFFDEVCYTGTGSALTVAHNLGVAPEMMIVKSRSTAASWNVYTAAMGAGNRIPLDADQAASASTTVWNNQAPTASVFSVGASSATNASGASIVNYLFATCPGVSKVGSYTGTAATQVINCGFAAGARFVLIKRTDDVGDWYIWDTVRGIVSGNDPYLLINNVDGSPTAEVTGTDYIDPAASGFEISSTAPAAINASGGSFVFLAIS